MSGLILEIVHVSRMFGGLAAVSELSFTVEQNKIKSVIGPNGAGKTTLFNLITGVIPPSEGEIRFMGKGITGLGPHTIARCGISRTFQMVELFGNMSILENVMVGRHIRTKAGLFSSGFRFPSMKKEEKEIMAASMRFLSMANLDSKAHQPASSLPLGEQRFLEVIRAMATEPQLILLDEPAAGLNEVETQVMADLIYEIRSRGVTVLLVEHDMSLVMKISEEIVVLNFGVKIAEGTPEVVKNNPEVIKAYLGESE